MPIITLWKDKKNEQLDPEFFSKEAERLAQKVGDEAKKDDRGNPVSKSKYRNKNSQVRRYFDEIVRLNDIAQQGTENDMQYKVLPQVHMLIAKVVYAKGRKLVTDSFVKMMKDGINQIHDRKDIQVFTNFLESFMGFYKVHGPN